MTVYKKNGIRGAGPLFRIVLPILTMYVVWGGLVITMGAFGNLPIGRNALAVIIPLSIAVYMIAASFVTEIFIVFVDDQLNDAPVLRMILLAMTGLILAGLYTLSVKAGVKGQALAAAGTANLLVFACLCATWMTSTLKKPSELVPVCAVVALADMFSVLAGPTRHIAETIASYYEKGMEGPPPFTDFILIKIAVPGIAVPMPLFGVSDWIILAFLSAAMLRFGLNDSVAGGGIGVIKQKKRLGFYFPVAALGLLTAVLSAQFTGMFLPALPVMVLFFLAFSLWRHEPMRRLSRKEWVLICGFSAVMLSILGAALYLRSGFGQ